MLVLVCNSDVSPCPVADQQWISPEALADPALYGITPELVLKVVAWGFGFVFTSFLIGWVLAVAIGLVRKA